MTSLLIGTAAANTEIKQFDATVVLSDYFAGATDVTATVSVTNLEGTPHELGSFNVYVPAALGGQVYELRELALQPGETYEFTTEAFDIACGSVGTYTWVIEAKQSNDFNGTGNEFVGNAPEATVSGECSMAFVAGPADAERFTGITSVDGDPAAAPITVEVKDGNNDRMAWYYPIVLELTSNPGGATLSGGSTYADSGLASFTGTDAPSIDVSAAGYTLGAVTSDGTFSMQTAPSAQFTIFDAYVDCGGGACSASSSAHNDLGTTEAEVSSEAAGAIVLSVGNATASLDCPGLVEVSSVVEFDVIDSALNKTVALTWIPWLQPARKYDVCWGSPTTDESGVEIAPFTTADGTPAVEVGNLYVGVLPNCKKPRPDLVPCIAGYDQDRKAGSVTFTITAPPGDPVIRVG
jgi:hypothetical protein